MLPPQVEWVEQIDGAVFADARDPRHVARGIEDFGQPTRVQIEIVVA